VSLHDEPVTTTDTHNNEWQEIPTGRWLVQWYDWQAGDWHRKPFVGPVVVDAEEVARDVLEEVRAWLVADGPWRASAKTRTVWSAVVKSDDACDRHALAIVARTEQRSVARRQIVQTVEVDGHAYTRTEEQVTLGEWEPDPLLVSQQETPSIWPRSTPYPDSRTRSVGASIRPEIVRVLLSCGRREETP
jgi:hypothetical protein